MDSYRLDDNTVVSGTEYKISDIRLELEKNGIYGSDENVRKVLLAPNAREALKTKTLEDGTSTLQQLIWNLQSEDSLPEQEQPE
jgi:hypothetical protein